MNNVPMAHHCFLSFPSIFSSELFTGMSMGIERASKANLEILSSVRNGATILQAHGRVHQSEEGPFGDGLQQPALSKYPDAHFV